MNIKIMLFNVMLSLTIVQEIYPNETENDLIFTLLNNPDQLRDYLNRNPHAIHQKTIEGDSVLAQALINHNLEVLEIVLAANADPDEAAISITSDPYFPNAILPRQRPLHFLASKYQLRALTPSIKNIIAEQAALLILYGANDTLTDQDNHIPIEISPKLIEHVNAIIHDQEKLAHTMLIKYLSRKNIGFSMELAKLLGHTYQE